MSSGISCHVSEHFTKPIAEKGKSCIRLSSYNNNNIVFRITSKVLLVGFRLPVISPATEDEDLAFTENDQLVNMVSHSYLAALSQKICRFRLLTPSEKV